MTGFEPSISRLNVKCSTTVLPLMAILKSDLGAQQTEVGFSVSEKVHTQMELSSVSGSPFSSGHELLVFQLKFRNRLSGTEDWKWTSDGILWMGLRNLNLDFQIKDLSVFNNKKIDFFQKYSMILVVLSLEPTIKIIWIL